MDIPVYAFIAPTYPNTNNGETITRERISALFRWNTTRNNLKMWWITCNFEAGVQVAGTANHLVNSETTYTPLQTFLNAQGIAAEERSQVRFCTYFLSLFEVESLRDHICQHFNGNGRPRAHIRIAEVTQYY